MVLWEPEHCGPGIRLDALQVEDTNIGIGTLVEAEEVDAEEVDAEEVDAEEVDAEEVDAEEVDAEEVDAEEEGGADVVAPEPEVEEAVEVKEKKSRRGRSSYRD
jgi:hypothetical protein